MSLADLAYCIMLCECGLMTHSKPVSRSCCGLLELHAILPEQFPFDPIYGDIYTSREQALPRRRARDMALTAGSGSGAPAVFHWS